MKANAIIENMIRFIKVFRKKRQKKMSREINEFIRRRNNLKFAIDKTDELSKRTGHL